MSFSITISHDFIQIDPGTTLPINVKVINHSKQGDQYELQIEGLDYEWLATPIPSFPVEAEQSHNEKILIKPPRTSESLVGTYPFVIKVRSLQDGKIRSAQGTLEVKPFYNISIDITPKRGIVSPFKKEFIHTITMINLGNTEVSLQMFANDPEEACAFEFEQDKVTLGAGQQKSITLFAQGARRPLLANSRLFGFSVVARNIDGAPLMATAQAQLEQRAIASPGTFLAGLTLLALGIGWVATIPKPPILDRFNIDKQEIELGESVELEWSASNAKSVQILNENSILYDKLRTSGRKAFCPKHPGIYNISMCALGEGKKSRPEILHLVVKEPTPVPPPKILEFKINPLELTVKQTFAVNYKLSPSVVKATLSPPGILLDPKIQEIEVIAARAGDIAYKLIAENQAGEIDQKTIHVNVVDTDTAHASILSFQVKSDYLSQNRDRVQITWQLNNAAKAELKDGEETFEIDPVSGEKEILLSEPKTITIIAYDAQGRTVQKHIQLEGAQAPYYND